MRPWILTKPAVNLLLCKIHILLEHPNSPELHKSEITAGTLYLMTGIN